MDQFNQGKNTCSCEACNQHFTTTVELKHHKLVHNKGRKHVCETCHSSFSTARLLVCHTKTQVCMHGHSNDDDSSTQEMCCICSQCGKSFSESSFLEKHVSNFH